MVRAHRVAALGWLLVTTSVGVHLWFAGRDATGALLLAPAAALVVGATALRPVLAPWSALAVLVMASMVLGRTTSVLFTGSLALWMVQAGVGHMQRARSGIVMFGLLVTAASTAFSTGLVLPLVALAGTWVLAIWLNTTPDRPSWVLAVDRLTDRLGAAWDRSTRRRRQRAGFSNTMHPAVDQSEPGSAASGLLTPVMAWLAVTAAASWIQTVAVRTAEYGVSLSTLLPFPSPTSGKGGWDTLYYINIAMHGYNLPAAQDFTTRPAADLVAYFPGYPVVIRAVALLPGVDESLASILIALAGGVSASMLLWIWTRDRGMSIAQRRTTLAVFLVYPYSFMLTGVAYAEPMTLALVLGAFVLLERDRHLVAGLVAACATATRPTALPLLVALPVLALEQGGSITLRGSMRAPAAIASGGPTSNDGHDLDVTAESSASKAEPAPTVSITTLPADLARRWGSLLAGFGVGAFSLWLIGQGRSPIAFWEVQSNYGQGSALDPGTWLKLDFLRALPDMGWGAETINRLAGATATILAAISLPSVARRFGLAYATFVAGLIAAVLLGARFFSPGGRYLSLAFPTMAIVGLWLAPRPRTRAVVLAVLAAGWVLLTWRFARTDSLGW